MMNRLLFVIPALLFVFGMSYAHAQSSNNVDIVILEYDGDLATVQMTWNDDETVVKHEAGCVSCMPNVSEFTSKNSIILNDVSHFPNTSNAMLYFISYDSQDNIVHAEQIIVNLEQ